MGNPPLEPGAESPSGVRALLSSNAFRIGIVLLSAAIIFGAWAFADRVSGPSDRDEPALSLGDDDFEAARRAAESGEATAAITLLERILADDPGHERAASLHRRLTSDSGSQNGGTAAPGNGADEGATEEPPAETPRDDSEFLEPVDDVLSLLPEVISGWSRGIPVADETDATVPFEPAQAGVIGRATFSVHDRGSEADAQAFIERTSGVVFASDPDTVRVGAVEAYFGTDGTRLATVAFARGRFAFEVVVVVPDGDPASVREQAIELAQEFDAAR